MKPIISVEGLGKKYTIRHEGQGRYRALREDIFKLPQRLFQRKQDKEEFWALKDVSFDIMPGDRVGIIGRNGAGKSTLLKLLSRITEPSTGKITLRGRVASLLEVGTGFHPELTGRENIFLNGAILGMSRAEVRRKFDEIVDFAGVEKFLDTPVKRYSSGMYVRLAFAVAAHLEPEILIVDEVLAVGDAEFQKKCLGKMEQVGQDGRTVLFVSHNMAAVQRLCTTGMLLFSGKLSFFSSIEEAYLKYTGIEESKKQAVFLPHNVKSYIKDISLYNDKHDSCCSFSAGEKICIIIRFQKNIPKTAVEIRLKNNHAMEIGFASSLITQKNFFSFSDDEVLKIFFDTTYLLPGLYSLDFIFRIPEILHIENIWDLVQFNIKDKYIGNYKTLITASHHLGGIYFPDCVFLKEKKNVES